MNSPTRRKALSLLPGAPALLTCLIRGHQWPDACLGWWAWAWASSETKCERCDQVFFKSADGERFMRRLLDHMKRRAA